MTDVSSSLSGPLIRRRIGALRRYFLEIIQAAAKSSGLPPDMVAGIAWQEIGGQPAISDDIVDTIREQADAPWGLSPVTAENLPRQQSR